MAEVSRNRLLINFVIGVFTLSAFTVAIYFVGVGGGGDKTLVASLATITFVISIAALTWGTYSYSRNPNYQPNLNLSLKLNSKWIFWLVGAPVLFYVLFEIFYWASGVLVAIVVGLLAFAGFTVPEAVTGIVFGLTIITGIIASALFVRWAWRRFNAA
jgi:hypothetical protein